MIPTIAAFISVDAGTASGDQVGRWSMTVKGNWRLTFGFEGTDVVLLDYEDYH